MAIREILLLGNDDLYKKSLEISVEEILKVKQIIEDLRDTLLNFREIHGFGRAIAAPQIGESFRIIFMILNHKEYTLINPKLVFKNSEKYQLWDDCFSLPGLEVNVERYKECILEYIDLDFNYHVLDLNGDMSELVQHEYDHLDGILTIERAINSKSFRINKEKI